MNIFYLHYNVIVCARWHVDRHVVKMILETCQLLCSALWSLGIEAPYKNTHKNHPSAVWTRDNISNWKWLQALGMALCYEYRYRYGKIHRCEEIIQGLLIPPLPRGDFTPPTPVMPEEYKRYGEGGDIDSLASYREYYKAGKKHLHFWKNGRLAWKRRGIPKFIKFSNEIS